MKLKSNINLEHAFAQLKDGLIDSEKKWQDKTNPSREAKAVGTLQGTVIGILNWCTEEGAPDLSPYKEAQETGVPTIDRHTANPDNVSDLGLFQSPGLGGNYLAD